MTARHLSLAMAIIALVMTPILLCCGSAGASAQTVVTEHDCGHVEQSPQEPTDDQACDGCDDCAPTAVVTTPKTFDQAPALLSASLPSMVTIIARSDRADEMWPPGRAPPRATPARLHDKLTV